MKYKCVFWDWNGTLLDDVQMNLCVFNTLMRDFGFKEISLEKYKSSFKFPVSKFYEEMGFDFTKYDYKAVGEHFISIYNSRRFDCNLTEGAQDCISFLHSHNVGQNILSAYERNHLLSAVKHYGIDSYFDNICGLENVYAASKIELGRALVGRLNIAPERILMVGDTDHDKHVADAIGVDCVMLATGHNNYQRLEALGTHVFKNQLELLNFFKLQ